MIKHLTILAAVLPGIANADEIYGNVDFHNGWQNTDGSYQTAIEFDLLDGWKTYWRMPGPAGIPPDFDWGGSTNIADVEVQWPTPHVFDSYGLYSIGYKGRVTLPLKITPKQVNTPVNVDLRLDFGVCSDVCVPASARFITPLNADQKQNVVSDIKTALSQAPQTAADAGIKQVSCSLTPNGAGFDIRADILFSSRVHSNALTVIEYSAPDIWIDIPESSINGQSLSASTTLEYYGDTMLMIDRGAINITVIAGDESVEIRGCPAS